MEVRFSTTCKSLSLGMVINVSTLSFNSLIPASALRPSAAFKKEGFGNHTYGQNSHVFRYFSYDRSCACACTPPMPAVIKTISEPLSTCDFPAFFRSLLAYFGSAPAPRPLVSFSPIWIFWLAWERYRACLSVLMAINSTFQLLLYHSIDSVITSSADPITFICAN